MMTAAEKLKHPWSCDVSRGDIQCPFVYRQCAGGYLSCAWRSGHPSDMGHQDCYDGDSSDRGWFNCQEESYSGIVADQIKGLAQQMNQEGMPLHIEVRMLAGVILAIPVVLATVYLLIAQ